MLAGYVQALKGASPGPGQALDEHFLCPKVKGEVPSEENKEPSRVSRPPGFKARGPSGSAGIPVICPTLPPGAGPQPKPSVEQPHGSQSRCLGDRRTEGKAQHYAYLQGGTVLQVSIEHSHRLLGPLQEALANT